MSSGALSSRASEALADSGQRPRIRRFNKADKYVIVDTDLLLRKAIRTDQKEIGDASQHISTLFGRRACLELFG